LTKKLKQLDDSIQSLESNGGEQTNLLNKLKGEKSVLESNISSLEEQADSLEIKVNQNEKQSIDLKEKLADAERKLNQEQQNCQKT